MKKHTRAAIASSNATSIIEAIPPQSHECYICGKVEPWNKDWQWYGSIAAIDDGHLIIKVCSSACREKLDALGRIEQVYANELEAAGVKLTKTGRLRNCRY